MSGTTHRIKRSETFFSLTILGVLIAIGVVIFTAQNRFNPAVQNFVPEIESASTPTVDAVTNNVVPSLPVGIQVMSPAERFDPETLSNKINGKAELYLSAGFVQLHTQRFRVEGDASTWFEVYIYDMGTPSNAFAVYSSQRRRDVESLALTQYAYGTSNALFFTSGGLYVEMIAANSGKAVTAMLTAFSEHYLAQFDGGAGSQEDAADPKQAFPVKDLVADSITLIPKDAFGFNRFDQVYTARYMSAETETTLFVSLRSSAREADTLASAYRDFLIEFGGVESVISEGSHRENFFAIDIMDTYELLFSKGPYLAGVHMAEDMEVAHRLMVLLEHQLDRYLEQESDKKEAVK